MKLYEFEGKQLFKEAGIPVLKNQIIVSPKDKITIDGPIVLKAQILGGGRGKMGLIQSFGPKEIVRSDIEKMLEKEVMGERIEKILVEPHLVDKIAEYYLSITYDTALRSPILLVSKKGGVGIESLAKEVIKVPINPLVGFHPWIARKALARAGFKGIHFLSLTKILQSLWNVFTKYDARLVEINPLIEIEDEEFYAADAKVILDDEAGFRRPKPYFSARDVLGRRPTESERLAKEIDANDHRGSAGSTYVELDGNIAVIAAGGGGSLVNMDALVALGGKPANYTEHSGNPPREKIKRLTEVVLSKKGLKGCLFVGATANFTDIFETLRGFVDGLQSLKPKPTYPIVIRRGGPRYGEAFEMLHKVGRKEGFDFHIFGPETPMTSTAKVVVDLVSKYKRRKK